MGDDIEDFIRQQKAKIANERQNLDGRQADRRRERKRWDRSDSVDKNQDTRRNGYKENIPPRGQTPEVPLVAKMEPTTESERRKKLREERNREYNSLLQRDVRNQNGPGPGIYQPPKEYSLDKAHSSGQQYKRGDPIQPPPRAPSPEMDNNVYRKEQQRLREKGRNGLDNNDGGAAMPGIVDRNSAKQRKVAERNREYNEFLERQKEKERHRFDKSKGGGTSRQADPKPDNSRPALSERPREPDRRERERRLEEYDRQRDYDEPPRRRRDEDDFDDRRAPPRGSRHQDRYDDRDTYERSRPRGRGSLDDDGRFYGRGAPPPRRDGRYRDRYNDDPRDRHRDEWRDRYDDTERPMDRFRGRLEDSYRDDRSRRPPSPSRPRPNEDEEMSLPLRDRSSAKGKPRKGWGTPTYEEILDEKRKQERDYRRHDDPEVVYGRPMRSSYSDGHLNKSFEEERLDQLDREVEEKKVRFRNDLRQPTGRGILDDRDWLEGTRGPPKSRYDPDQEFQEWDRNLGDNRQRIPTAGNVELAVRPVTNFNDRRQRVTSAPLDVGGGGALPLGNEPPESIARRKEQYRRELEQQMQESAQNKKRERYNELRVNATGEVDIPHRNQGRSTTLGNLNPISPRGIRRETQPSYNTAPIPSAPERERRPDPRENRDNSYLQNQPSLGPYNTPGDESYHYYGMVDPLSLEPTRTTALQFSGTPALIPLGGGGGGGHPAVPPLYASDRVPRVTFDDSGETTRTTPRKGKYDSDMVSAAIPTVDDRDQLNEKRTKAAEYQRELERQMQEQKMKKLREKAEKDAYERKLEEEIRNYNPFGRGGGGAPLKDATGNIVADLRSHQGGGGPQLGGTTQELGGGGQIASTPRSVRNNEPNYLTPRGPDGEPTHARGGHGIFGAPKTNAEKDVTEKYKEELRLQIEEQKRREEERRRLEKEEEEREQRKIEAQQQRMKDEYEAELQKQRQKDEEARRANEEIKNAAENKRLDLERQRKEEEEKRMEELRRNQEEDRLARMENSSSPPIPTLNKEPTPVSQSTKVQPEQEKPIKPVEKPPQSPVKPKQQRSNSPPVPSLRKDQQYSPSSSRMDRDRAGSATILTELDKMRKQLQNERNRVESSLVKDKYQVDVFDPRLAKPIPAMSSQPPLVPSTLQHPISPRDINVPNALNRKIDFDIFDAAIKNRVPAAVRRPHLAGDEVHPEVLDEFQKYKNKRTPSRQNFRNDFPDQPTSGFTLEAQQLALLREQEDQLNKMRRKPFDDAFVDDLSRIPPMGDMGSKSQLQSDSAFIDMDGLPINPHDYERSSSVGSRVPSARERRRHRESPKPSGSRTQPDTTSLGSTTSLDPERIRKKNDDRLKRLNAIAGDGNKSSPPTSPKKKPSPSPVQEGMVNRGTSRPRSSSIEETSPIRRPRPAKTQPTPRKGRVSTPVTKHATVNGAPPRPPKVPPRPPRERSPESFASTPPPRLPPPRSKRTPRRFTPSPPPPVPPRHSYSKSQDRSHPATMASPYLKGKTPRRVQTPDSRLGHGADDVSLQDPDDIIDRFISKQQHNRPPSGTTLGDDEEAWLRPSK
ncbi:centrosome and spindle pole-associated protein 1-like isoform X6 [Lineus longissimus]|uniref:centrosome and spindle pole-associated protein 1-like isoform X6 n=1 Tax=Lineus longissimus TaxID=88925 RepID=UPI00315DDB84